MKWGRVRTGSISRELQCRAIEAREAFELAESAYYKAQQQRDALKDRYRALMDRWENKIETRSLEATERQLVEREILVISREIADQCEPWHDAHRALISAQEEVRAILKDAGLMLRLDS